MSNIRFFQLAVPLLFLVYALYQFNQIRLHRKEWRDIVIPLAVVAMIMLIAVFPDRIATALSNYFDIKSNVNALLVLLIGVLFFLVFQLYELVRKLKKHITDLTVEISLLKVEKQNNNS